MGPCQLHKESIDKSFEFTHKSIEDLGTSIRGEIRANNELIQMQLQKILDQTVKTNGRVTKLEEETKVWRFAQQNPRSAFAIAVGLVFAVVKITSLGFEKVITLIK
jgi:hypothetical protein